MELLNFSILLFATARAVVSASTIPALFDYEKIQLREDKTYFKRADLLPKDNTCKTFPGDANWPNEEAWRQLNETTNGALLKPIPVASVCYNSTAYNDFALSACNAVSATWSNGFERAEHPIEVNSIMFEGLNCIPPSSWNSHGCRQGGYPVYVVNVTTVADVQAGVKFARENQVRLVIKNTGHDMSGKSLGGGSLSIWTHHLKDIVYYGNYSTDGYSGPAFKVGAGVQGREIYQAAFDRGLMAVGGVCDSVGLYGGYSQGGGHSMLGSIHGMGADQVLSFQVVTADGHFLTASPTENTDLFWAIRGGGGSAFGIVTSMVVKAFKDIETTVGTLGWSVQGNNITHDIFWEGIHTYFSYYENFTDQGTSAEWFLYPKGAYPLIAPPDGQAKLDMTFVAPGKTLEETEAITAPWLADMKALGINIQVKWANFPSYHTAYYSVFAPTPSALMPYDLSYASRLVPRENFDKNKKLNVTVAAYRTIADEGHMFNGYQYAPTLEAGAPVGPEGNAVNPAWRKALSHTIVFVNWPDNSTAQQQMQIRRDFAANTMKPLLDATPGAGSYLNEADRIEKDFQQSFYGTNYPRLLEIKKKYDPDDVFWAVTAVGSEGWAVRSEQGLPTEDGPLCRVTDESI